jgi:hypothetical protein
MKRIDLLSELFSCIVEVEKGCVVSLLLHFLSRSSSTSEEGCYCYFDSLHRLLTSFTYDPLLDSWLDIDLKLKEARRKTVEY